MSSMKNHNNDNNNHNSNYNKNNGNNDNNNNNIYYEDIFDFLSSCPVSFLLPHAAATLVDNGIRKWKLTHWN